MSDKTYILAQKIEVMKNEIENGIQNNLRELESMTRYADKPIEVMQEDNTRAVDFTAETFYHMKIENNRMKLQIELLKQQIIGLETQKKMLSDNFDMESKEHFIKLKLKCEELINRVKDLEEEITIKQTTLIELKEDVKVKERNIKSLHNQLLDCRENTRREILKSEIEVKTNITEEYNTKLADETIEDHKKVIISLCEEKGMAEAELITIKANMNTLLQEQTLTSQRRTEEITFLHKTLEDSEAIIKDLNKKLIDNAKELKIMKTENERLQIEISSLRNEVKKVREENIRIETEARMNENEVNRLSQELMNTAEEIERLKNQSQEYKLQINDLKQQLELTIDISK